jgi:hypothetical protein
MRQYYSPTTLFLQSDLFSSDFPIQVVHISVIAPMSVTCVAHPTLIDSAVLAKLIEETLKAHHTNFSGLPLLS